MIKHIRGVVTLLKVTVGEFQNYCLVGQPSLQVKTEAVLWGDPRPTHAKCVVENFYGDKEPRTLEINQLRKIVIVNEEYYFFPTISQIFSFQIYKEIGKEIEFPIFENATRGFEIHPNYSPDEVGLMADPDI